MAALKGPPYDRTKSLNRLGRCATRRTAIKVVVALVALGVLGVLFVRSARSVRGEPYEVARAHLARWTLAIDAGRFSTLQGYSILARQVDRANNELINVTIYGQDGDYLNVINAKRAELRSNEDFSKMLLTLHQGEIHVINRPFGSASIRCSIAAAPCHVVSS